MRLIKLGLCSVNTTVGAFGSNVDRALTLARQMAAEDVTVAAFNEQLIGGYPPEDLIQWQGFVDRQWNELTRFAEATARTPTVYVLGIAVAHQGLRYNCAAVVAGGKIRGLVPKEKLPTYNVFYEGRTFSRGFAGQSEVHRGVPLGDFLFELDFGTLAVEVCEDIWSADGPIKRRCYSGAELVVNLSASPYRIGVVQTRREMIATRTSDHQCTVAYANAVGANDGLIFDGGGYVFQNGRPMFEAPRWVEGCAAGVIDLDRTARLRSENTTWRSDREQFAKEFPLVPVIEVPASELTTRREKLRFPIPPHKSFFLPGPATPKTAREEVCEDVLDALALGIGDYFEKTNAFSSIGLALSGGRDSLLTLLIAHRYAKKAGKDTQSFIQTFFMPTRFSSEGTRKAAEATAKELNVGFKVLSIDEAFERELAATVAMLPDGKEATPLTQQNIQARLRAQRMWNWANTSGALFLQTGNMSERAVGYTTIGGDLEGALSVIANVPKTMVSYLLEYLKEKEGYQCIDLVTARPAGPELAANQVGEDELMPFPILDACFYLFAGEKLLPEEMLQVLNTAFPEVPAERMKKHVDKFVRLFTQSIYKWVQAPLSLHIGNLDLDCERALQVPVVSRNDWSR